MNNILLDELIKEMLEYYKRENNKHKTTPPKPSEDIINISSIRKEIK